MNNRPKTQGICETFMSFFTGIEFNISNSAKPKRANSNILKESESYIKKMLISSKKTLSKANKLHRAGKMSSEELQEHQWRVFELEEELRKMKDDGDLNEEDN